MITDVLDVARLFRFIRETTQNQGQRVVAIQHWAGGEDAEGQSWCADLATMVLDLYYQGKSPITRTASCDSILEEARAKRLLRDTPEVGDLYLRLNNPNDAHHVGFVTDVSRWSERVLGTFSGNTSSDGTSSNGDGAYEHDITIHDPASIAFVRHSAA